MYWFGKKEINLEYALSEKNWKDLSGKRLALAETSIDSILDVLDRFSKLWTQDSNNFKEALPKLVRESGFSLAETEKTLSILPLLLNRDSLEKRLRAELVKTEVLDRFTKLPHGAAKVKATPQGILLHVTAGNVFLSSIDSLIMGFLTKNLSILKVSGQNTFFPEFFAEKLQSFDTQNMLSDKFAVLHWKGGDEKTESFIKGRVNTIIAWGGEEMLASYRKNLPPQVKLLDFGPKISLQVLTKRGLENKKIETVAQKIVDDIVPWDQGACASPQDLYLQEGIQGDTLLHAIEEVFKKAPSRGNISDDEATEILKEKYRGLYSELMEGGRVLSGENYLLHLENNKILKPSPLNRSLIIKHFKNEEELFELLSPFSFYLQSCSYLLDDTEKDSYLSSLALTGIKRFAPLGTITWGMEGAPHDGRFVLRELVHFIAHEARVVDYGEENSKTHDSSSIKTYFENSLHPKGHIFSSGGTTGEPKFVHFSYEEFDYMSDMLAENLRRQGLKAGMKVANLFVAGNLWSSFMCVDKALEKIGVIQLPIGGLCDNSNILFYLKKFRPDAVMGIPSLLVMNAEYMKAQNEELEIPLVFYAGEALSQTRRDFLKEVWKTKSFGSAGYASVDAGVIGYQCSHSQVGEHHLFSDLVKMEIIDDEAVVTTLARNSMPIKNYRTGDRAQWVDGKCSCGSVDPRFKLLGRIDSVIQIWSCRLLSTDVESVIHEYNIKTFQMTLTESREANVVREKLKITYEKAQQELDQEAFLLNLYERSRDVRDTIKFQDFKKDLELVEVKTGEIPRNPRTGKISLILDQRR